MKPKATSEERLRAGSAARTARGAGALHLRILNADRMNAGGAAAATQTRLYQQLYRNVMRQLALVTLVGAVSGYSFCSAAQAETFFARGHTRVEPGAFAVGGRENCALPKAHSCNSCRALLDGRVAPELPREPAPCLAGQAPGWQTSQSGGAARISTARALGTFGGPGPRCGFSSNPVTTAETI